MANKTIIFTGGGSAGHVTPNLALIAKCKENNWQISYIGSKHGIEKQLICDSNYSDASFPHLSCVAEQREAKQDGSWSCTDSILNGNFP